jgi:hypothetical protein
MKRYFTTNEILNDKEGIAMGDPYNRSSSIIVTEMGEYMEQNSSK